MSSARASVQWKKVQEDADVAREKGRKKDGGWVWEEGKERGGGRIQMPKMN